MINNTRSKRYAISVDDYNKIIQMKKDGKLNYTHYLTLWKAILLTKLLSSIDDNEISFFNGGVIRKIRKLLEQYNFEKFTMDTFSPVNFMDNVCFSEGYDSSATNGFVSGDGKTQYENTSRTTEQKYVYEDNWIKFINQISNELSALRLKNNHYLFIDGIDTRPTDISHSDYTECIYPLVRAVYDLNSDILSKIKDRNKGRLQIVLLTRLDVFLRSGLSNSGSKISDNGAFLNWGYYNENSIRTSDIYFLVCQLLKTTDSEAKDLWTEYFDFKIKRGKDSYSSFNYFLRMTACRPRDFVKLLKIAKEQCTSKGIKNPNSEIIQSDLFQRSYSTYFVDSLRTGLGFYYNVDEMRILIDFIRSIRMTTFSYKVFRKAYECFCDREQLSDTFRSCFDVLSLLFENNVIWLST